MQIADAYRSLLERGRSVLAGLPPLDLRTRALNLARVAAGFFLTFLFLSAVGVVFLAAQSRVRLDPPASEFDFTPGRSASLQAVEHLFAMSAQDPRSVDEARVFEPGVRRFREQEVRAGAQAAALEFLYEVRMARGARNTDFAELRSLAADPAGRANPAGIAAAAQRVNAAVARGRVELNWEDGEAFERLIVRAAEGLEDRAAEIAAHTHPGRLGMVAAPTEGLFFRARGEAYGWALILRGAAIDSHALASPDLSEALESLDRAAATEPLFLFNGPRESAVLPNHLSHIALDFELAADALRRVSKP
jgi:hypothetical protein